MAVSDKRRAEIVKMVRAQIAGAIEDDLDGGESLMKEVWENLDFQDDDRAEMQVATNEMRRIIRAINDG